MLDRSCRFPNTDPHQLWILLAGRKVTLSEWKSWTRTLYGGRKWFFLIAFATLLLFAMDMVQSLTFGYKWYESVAMITLMVLSVAAAGYAFIRLLCAPMKQAVAAYEEYEADTANDSVRIAIYGDYLKMVTLRGETVLQYKDITVYRETENGFLLGDGTKWIVIRAKDLTPYLADIVRAYFSERIAAGVRQIKGAVAAELQQPITPIPYYKEATPFFAAEVPWKTTPMARQEKAMRGWMWCFVAAVGLFFGLGVAMWVPITSWFFVDLACACVGGIVVAMALAGLTVLLCDDRNKQKMATVAFEPDGLRITDQRESRFYAKERLWVEERENGVTVHFTDTDTLFVPQADIEE